MADRTTGGSHEQQTPKMSVLQKNVRLKASAISVGVNRWLLLCRFDFHQKTWRLPAWEIHRGWDRIFPNDAGELASAVAQRFPELITSLSPRQSPSQPATRRTNFRCSRTKSLDKTKTRTKKNKPNLSIQRSRSAGGRSSPPPALKNPQPYLVT